MIEDDGAPPAGGRKWKFSEIGHGSGFDVFLA